MSRGRYFQSIENLSVGSPVLRLYLLSHLNHQLQVKDGADSEAIFCSTSNPARLGLNQQE